MGKLSRLIFGTALAGITAATVYYYLDETTPDAVTDAEDLGKTVVEAFPGSAMADEYRTLAKKLLAICIEI